MAAGKRTTRRAGAEAGRKAGRATAVAPAPAPVPAARTRRTRAEAQAGAAPSPRTPRTAATAPATSARTRRLKHDPPAVAPCLGLDELRALPMEQAREHVHAYLHSVMAGAEADAFEARAYRWELHLVDIEQVQLVRGVDLDAKKLRTYRMRLARGGGFPPLVALGSEGRRVTEGVLLCDGYHRAAAIRNAGIPFVWAWLAVGLWSDVDGEAEAAAARVPVGAGAARAARA